MSIAVLIPCYNEALTICKVVKDFRKNLPGADIYVYDNNSTDGTADIAREAGAIVRHEPKQGKGNVINSMLRDIDADCYLMVDGDDTYPAECAWELCHTVMSGKADMAIGDRLTTTYKDENKRPFHNVGNELVRFLVNFFFAGRNRWLNDIMTGYRAMSREFAKSLPVLSEGFQIETEISIHALENKCRIVSVPINYRDRPEGSFSKLNTVKDGTKVLKVVAKEFVERKILKRGAHFEGTSCSSVH